MKKMIFSIVLICILSSIELFSAIDKKYSLCCELQHPNVKCVSDDGRTTFIDAIRIECWDATGGAVTVPDIPISRPGYDEVTYWYEPDQVNPLTGRGVIDGLRQYSTTDPTAPQYAYIYDNSLVFADYSSWAAALTARGITPPTL